MVEYSLWSNFGYACSLLLMLDLMLDTTNISNTDGNFSKIS